MAATVLIQEHNGTQGAEVQTDKTSGSIRFKNADNATVDSGDPLIAPASGQEYSYEKWLRLNVTVAPSANISNLKAYSDGANGMGTGVKVWYATDTAYSTPVVPSESNDPPQHDLAGMTDFFAATAASPISLGAGPYTGTGQKGDYLVLVMEIESTTGQGSVPGETITFAYDEI